jgi:hypothetical protein
MRAGWAIATGVVALVVTGLVVPAAGAASSAATDKQIATTGVLVTSDFPTTYSDSPRDPSADRRTQKLASTIAACKKLVAFMQATDRYPEAKSDDFDQGQTSIDNTVTVFPTAAKAKAAVDAYAATGVPACFKQLVGKVAQRAGGKAVAQIKKVDDVTAGDQAIAYEGPVQITESDGSTAAQGFGNLVIRVGRGVLVYSYNHDANTAITDDLKAAVSSSGGRLQQALAG